MEFDNKQFENGAKTTMSTLDKLKQSLNFGSSVNSLSRLESAGRSFSLKGITDSIDVVCDRFSTMGVVGQTIIQNLTNSAIAMARKITGIVTTPIIEGGKTRALNIEQAKFQLQGLGVAWDTIKDDINYGVKDTAYGLDAAAKVASQLVASNIEVGDSMKTALRAVSGVAAMTNSSYEEIGHIFTTVAGNGKLMTEQLRMLSARGLNIAAELGKQLGKTEAEIRDMVTKGQIDFKTFANAMDKAFGEHAKDANKTFTGALSNMRAALSRIGADLATPAFENLRKAINSLTPVIDGVHESLKPLIEILTKGMEKASEYAVKVLDSFGAVEEKNLDELEDIANRVIAGEFGMGEERRKNLEALGYAYEDVQAKVNNLLGTASKVKSSRDFSTLTKIVDTLVKSFTNLGNGIIQAVKPIKESFEKVFPPITLERIQKFADTFEQLTAKFKISDAIADKLKRTFTGLFTAVDMVKRFGVSLLKTLSPMLSVFARLGEKILDLAAKFGDYISELDKTEKKNSVFAKALQKASDVIVKVFDKVKETLGSFPEKLKTALSKVKPMIGEFKKIFLSFFNSFAEGYKEITGVDLHIPTFKELLGFIVKIKDKFIETATSIGKSDSAVVKFFKSFIPDKETIIEKLKIGFKNLGILVGTIRNRIIAFKEELPKIKENITKFLDQFKIKDAEKKTAVIEGIANVLNFVSGIVSKVSPKLGEGLSKISQSFGDTFSKIDYGRMAKLLNIGFFVVLLTSINKLRGVLSSLGSFGRVFHNINGIFVGVKNTLTAYTNDLKSNTLLKIAGAVGILALSLIALSAVKADRLNNAVKAMLTLFGALMSAMFMMQWIAEIKETSSFDLMGIAVALIGITVAISALASAVKKLAQLDPKNLMAGLVGVISLIAALAVFLKTTNIGKFYTPTILEQGAAILIISVALNVMAVAVKKLSEIEFSSMIKGILGLAGVMTILAVFTKKATGMTKAVSTAVGITIIAASMLIFAKAIDSIGQIPFGNIVKSLVSIAALLGVIAAMVRLMPATIPIVGVGLIAVATALVILAKAVNVFSGASWTTVLKSLVAITGILTVLAIALNAMVRALPGAAALLVASAALAVIAPVLKILGSMEWSSILKGLIGLAGSLAILGAASVILVPVLPAMAALAVVMAALGTGMLALGAGMALVAAGVGALALSSVGITTFITALTSGISLLIESLVSIVMVVLDSAATLVSKISDVAWQIIVTLLQGISNNIGLIVQAGMTIIIALLRGLSENIDTVVVLAVTIIVKLLNGFSKMIPSIVNAGINLMVALINGMANGIRENGGIVMEAIKNLISSIIEFAITSLQETVETIPGVGKKISDQLENAKTAIRNSLTGGEMNRIGRDSANETLGGIWDSAESANSAGEGLGNSVINGLSGVLGDFGSMGTDFGMDFSQSLEGTNDFAWDSGNDLGTSAIDGLNISMPDFSSLGTDFGAGFSDALSGTDNLVFSSAEGLGDTAIDGLDFDFSSLGLSAGDTYSLGLAGSEDGVESSAGSLASSALKSIDSTNKLFKNSGSDNGKSYNSGVTEQKKKSKDAGTTIAVSGYKGAASQVSYYRAAGKDSGRGYANGLNDSVPEVQNAAAYVANAALVSMRATLDMNSPSKETEDIGMYSDKGLANGLRKYFGVVKTASEYVGDHTKASLQKALSKVSDILNGDVELDPTIRPVVDLSSVAGSMNVINGMFGDRSIKLGSDIRPYRNDLNLTTDISAQLLKNSMNGSSEVVRAIDELRGDVYYLGDMLSKMQVRMDSGALVGSIVTPMNNALGERLVRKGRSN